MPTSLRRVRVVFDEVLWAEDLRHSTTTGRAAATATRHRSERDGIDLGALKSCDPDHHDGTRLAGCAKLYVPPPDGQWGIVVPRTLLL